MFLYTNFSRSKEKFFRAVSKKEKILQINGNLIALDIDDEYLITSDKEKIFILSGFFFADEFPNQSFSKQEQLHYISSLNDSELEEFLKGVDGFFTLILFNTNKKELTIFSDHICSVPVFFTRKNGSLVLSNHQKKLIRFIQEPQLDKIRMKEYFMFLNTQSGRTFYQGISKTLPRECLHIKNDNIQRREYYKFDYKIIPETNFETLKEEHKELFLKSVKNCSHDYDKVGTALSGGLDSSSITSALHHLGKTDIHAKTAVFPGLNKKQRNKVSEEYYSEAVAKALSISHTKIELFNTGCISDNTESSEIFPEPTGLVNGYIHHAIFKNLKNSNIALYLDGFAGDSVIGHGYTKLYELGKKFNLIELINEDKKLHQKKGGRFSTIRSLKKYFLPNILPERVLWWIDSNRKNKNLNKAWISRINKAHLDGDIFSHIVKHYGHYPNKIPSAKKIHLSNLNSANISMGVYHATYLAAQYGVKIRFPFLSKKLMELSLNTPVDYKLRDGIDRYIFRESMRGIVPDRIIERTTKSDLSPLSRNEIMNLDLEKLLNSLKKNGKDYFNYGYIKNQTFKNKEENFTEIFQIYEFIKWIEKKALNLD